LHQDGCSYVQIDSLHYVERETEVRAGGRDRTQSLGLDAYPLRDELLLLALEGLGIAMPRLGIHGHVLLNEALDLLQVSGEIDRYAVWLACFPRRRPVDLAHVALRIVEVQAHGIAM